MISPASAPTSTPSRLTDGRGRAAQRAARAACRWCRRGRWSPVRTARTRSRRRACHRASPTPSRDGPRRGSSARCAGGSPRRASRSCRRPAARSSACRRPTAGRVCALSGGTGAPAVTRPERGVEVLAAVRRRCMPSSVSRARSSPCRAPSGTVVSGPCPPPGPRARTRRSPCRWSPSRRGDATSSDAPDGVVAVGGDVARGHEVGDRSAPVEPPARDGGRPGAERDELASVGRHGQVADAPSCGLRSTPVRAPLSR